MLLKFVTLISLGIPVILSKPRYNLVHERAQLVEWNQTLARDVEFKFGRYNRTTFALNVEFTALHHYNDRKVMLAVLVDKLYGTEYKRTGTTFRVNLCKFWEKNVFGMREQLEKVSNLEACDVEPKPYYVHDFLLDYDKFPPILPYGSYRIDIRIYHEDGAQYFRLFWFSRVEPLVRDG